jgi:hypothetical protein
MGRVKILIVLLIFVASPALVLLRGQPLAELDWWRLAAWILCTISFIGLLLLGGTHLKGLASGILIDSRNRYSLSQLQIVAWSALAVPALAVTLGNNALRMPATSGFPDLSLDWTLIALMGISLGSFLTTPIALSVKSRQTPDPSAMENLESVAAQQGLSPESLSSNGSLVTKTSAKDARLSDLVTGEEIGNAATLDITRIQMLAITAVVWMTYAVLLFNTISLGGADGWLISSFPSFNSTLLALLLVSHAGYIAGKVAPKTPQQSDASERDMERALSSLADVDSLRSQIDSALILVRVTVSEELQLKRLREQLEQVQANLANARADLGSGRDVGDVFATSEGQIAAIKTVLRSIISDQQQPRDGNEPGPDLVRTVKQKLKERGAQTTNGTSWAASDEQSLLTFLDKVGLKRQDLSPIPYRAFEEVLDLTA